MRDWLTELLNRRGFFAAIESAQTGFEGGRRSIALLAIDIDHFKHINDAQGHAAGDQVLQQFAQLLKGFAAKDRIISRMGGEEFLVTLFDSTAADATTLAEAIRQQAERSHVLLDRDKSIAYTVSIGVHQLAADESIERGMAAADKALYQAKHDGRNRVVFHAVRD